MKAVFVVALILAAAVAHNLEDSYDFSIDDSPVFLAKHNLGSWTPNFDNCNKTLPFITDSVVFNAKPERGKDIVGTLCGHFDTEKYVKESQIALLKGKSNLGNDVVKIGKQVAAGEKLCYNYKHSVLFIAPSGTYDLTGTLVGQDGKTAVGCTHVWFDL